jgi:hypothetical protein
MSRRKSGMLEREHTAVRKVLSHDLPHFWQQPTALQHTARLQPLSHHSSRSCTQQKTAEHRARKKKTTYRLEE